MNPEERPLEAADGTHSAVTGSAGDILQARDVSGGVHFHRSGPVGGPVPKQLPADVQVFVNRSAALDWLDAVLTSGGPACLLVGTAGVGKTSLAVRWAHRVKDRFPDGQLYVDLRGYDPDTPVSPEQALERFLRALDVSPGAIPRELDARAALFRSLVAERRVLVVLDNAMGTRQVRPLLPGADTCLTLVTSRNNLSGLVAREGARRLVLDVLTEADAVTLLRATINGYRTEDDPADIAELARLCARLPIALRIAAERASGRPRTPLGDLIRDLRDESALWRLLSSDDEETSAVRAVFTWSYRALSTEVAEFFRLLGLHPGPNFSSLSAAALTGRPHDRTRHLLDVLVGVHMLEQIGRDRFQFHDLLRAYAADQVQLEESGEDRRAALRRLVTWYLHTAHSAVVAAMYAESRFALVPLAEGTPPPAEFAGHDAAVDWYETERGNLVAVVIGANNAGFYDVVWQVPGVLRGLFEYRHPFDDWFTTGRIGLDATRRLGDRIAEAAMLMSLGRAHTQYQELGLALARYAEALPILRELGNRAGEVDALNGAGMVRLRLRELSAAESHFTHARALAEELSEIRSGAFASHLLGVACTELGRLDEALRHLEHAVGTLQRIGNQAMEIDVLVDLSTALRLSGRLAEAEETAQQAWRVATSTDDRIIAALSLVELGKVRLETDRAEAALEAFQQAAVLQRSLGNRGRTARALDHTGEAYQRLGRFEDAIAFHTQAVAVHREVDDPWWLANALHHLASALLATGAVPNAARHWHEALAIFERFPDSPDRDRAAAIRTVLSGLPDQADGRERPDTA